MGIPYLLLFLLPTQLALHFWPSWAFVFGIRVDFLAPAIYITDILALILIFTNLPIYKKYLNYLLFLLVFAAVNIFFSTSLPESVYRWLKIFEMVLLGIYFANLSIKNEKIIKTLFYSAIFFSLIGILQFSLGRSVGWVLYYFGERSFSSQTPGIALVNVFGQNFLRAYSTFSHPNSLAGYLGAVTLLSLGILKRKPSTIFGLIIISTCLFLSFSLTVFLGLGLALILKHIFSKTKYFKRLVLSIFFISFFVSLIFPIFSKQIFISYPGFNQNISQRLDLSYLAGKMVSERFWVGEGLNTFIANIPRFKGINSYSWLLQPVHNVPQLVLSETGIFGLLMLFILFFYSIKASLKLSKTHLVMAILFIVTTWTLDHYWFTLQQNLLLVSILLGLSFKMTSSWKKV
jgi:hypothetical protein